MKSHGDPEWRTDTISCQVSVSVRIDANLNCCFPFKSQSYSLTHKVEQHIKLKKVTCLNVELMNMQRFRVLRNDDTAMFELTLLLVYVGICPIIIREWPPFYHRMLWF